MHVQAQQAVKGKFIDFPYRADGYGKAEGEQRHKERGQVDGHALVAVEQRHHHKAEGARHQRAESVQKYIPVRHHVIEGTHLAQEDCAVQEQDIHDVQRRRQLKAKAAGQEGGQVNHHDAQQALQQHQCVICARALQRLGGGLIPEDQAVNQITNRQDKAEQDKHVNHARPFLRAGL